MSGYWDPFAEAMGLGLGTHNDPFQQESPIVKQTEPTPTGKGGKWRQTDLYSYKYRFRNRTPYDAVGFGRMSSLSAAQKEAQSFTEATRKRKREDEPMGKYAPGTLGRKYKPKFKDVPITPGTSRLRYVDHTPYSATHALYCGFNDVGPVDHMMRCLGESMALHYLRRVNDHRVSQTERGAFYLGASDAPVGSVSTWGELHLGFRRADDGAEDDVFNVVDNQSTATTAKTIAEIGIEIATIIRDRFTLGYELRTVTIYRQFIDQNVSKYPILHDPDAGRHTFKFIAKAKFKVQNTTEADAVSDVHNKDNIHANPLDGLVYKFQNRIPKYAPGWISVQSAAENLNNLEDLYTTKTQGIQDDINFTAASPETFNVPPPAPYTIWTNSRGRSKILIKPGEHRVLSLTEDYEGSINGFLKKYHPKTRAGDRIFMPPGGNCYLIGLKPTFRTGTNEDLQVQTEIDRYYAGLIVKRKLTSHPITNILS